MYIAVFLPLHVLKRTFPAQLRLLSWCVTVLAVSEEPQFLVSVAEWAVRHRLLVWATRLLVLTRLPLEELKHIMVSYWTFSMMNSMVLNVEERTDSARYRVVVLFIRKILNVLGCFLFFFNFVL